MPGSDRFIATYYTCFEDNISNISAKNNEWNVREKAYTTNMARREYNFKIQGRNDPLLPQSYRPISLLNIDYTIYTIIMPEILRKRISDLIHKDQTGYVPKRHMKNIRCFIIYLLIEFTPHQGALGGLQDTQVITVEHNWIFKKKN